MKYANNKKTILSKGKYIFECFKKKNFYQTIICYHILFRFSVLVIIVPLYTRVYMLHATVFIFYLNISSIPCIILYKTLHSLNSLGP